MGTTVCGHPWYGPVQGLVHSSLHFSRCQNSIGLLLVINPGLVFGFAHLPCDATRDWAT